MGNVLYLDLGMGAAGDMLAASLFDLLSDNEREEFLAEMNHAGLPDTVIKAEQVQKSGISGIHYRVQIHGEEELSSDMHGHEHGHEHEHEHEHEYEHEHMHGHGHEHMHGYGHTHEHHHGYGQDHVSEHEHAPEHGQDHVSEHEHALEHGHDHALEHSHDHEYGHDHEHQHGHGHEHTQEPSHEHGHTHEHSHEHGHTHEHSHEHGHTHEHHDMEEILSRVSALALPVRVKQDITAIYQDIAQAESRVHGRPVNEVHLHEVGMLDAIADIASVSLLLYKLAPDRICASPITTGFGAVRCAHGILPVPAPATAILLEGMPTRAGQVEGELCTPTGAALIRHFAGSFGQAPEMVPLRTGYGMGSKEFSRLNCIRATLGLIDESSRMNYGTAADRNAGTGIKEAADKYAQAGIEEAADKYTRTDAEETANKYTRTDAEEAADKYTRTDTEEAAGGTDEIIELACTVDDMTGEEIGFAVEELLRGGALDVWTSAVQMKKNRPGTIITVLCSEELRNAMLHLLFRHTSSIGVRETLHRRYILARVSGDKETAYGSVRTKTVSGYGTTRSKAEYEDLATIARSSGLSLREAREACR